MLLQLSNTVIYKRRKYYSGSGLPSTFSQSGRRMGIGSRTRSYMLRVL